MFFATAQVDKLTNRLDADFYNPEYLVLDEKIDKFQTISIGSISGDPKSVTYGVLKPRQDESKFLLARIQNFEDGFLNLDSCMGIEEEQFKQYARSECVSGDILVALGGYPGKACIISNVEPGLRININQHIARVRVNNSLIDAYYLLGYFMSDVGRLSLKRQISGSVQAGINLEDLRNLHIVKIATNAQKYIGEKVRQAERLRAWAKQLVNRADSTICSQFEFSLVPSMRSQPRSISSELLSPVSLGPEFARASEGQATFADSMKLEEYIDSCKCGDPIKSEDRVDGKYSYYGASGPIDKHNDYNFDGEYLIVAQDGSIGCANIARGKFWANNHVWVVKLNAAYDIDSVCRYLDEHFPYWKGVTTGSVVPKVTSENLLNVQVPIAIAKNEYIGDLLRLSSNATSLSSTLVNTAKLLVEDLIEGQVSEAELVSAQQALEAGDDSLDRALLERMTAEGVDGEGDPLFDDIDQLYDLLEQAKQALDAEDTMAEV
ncbi:restriction endonuclease subunit S [Vibrio parahaemolyticus]|nr:restriction endonuclease subunit S [Vibrio parahaemolyticus]